MELPDFIRDDPNWENRTGLLPETVYVRTSDGFIHSVMNRQALQRLLQMGGELVPEPGTEPAPEPEPVAVPKPAKVKEVPVVKEEVAPEEAS